MARGLWCRGRLTTYVATRIAAQLGVGREQFIKRVLGHSDGSVTAIYNRYGYVKEMRPVLEHRAMDLTTRESNVMSLHRTAPDSLRAADVALLRAEEDFASSLL